MDIPLTLSFIRYFLVCVLIVNGILLWFQRHVNTKPRVYLMIFSFGSALSISYSLFVTYKLIIPSSFPVLSITNLNAGFWELLLLYLYPIEVVSPNWLRAKRVLLLFLPWVILISIQFIFSINFINLSSFSDMINHIGEFNVWFRLLILFACIVPYTILILCIPHKWRENTVNKNWIYRYALGVQGLGIMYCASMLTGSVIIKCIHLFYAALLFLYITYQELFLRLFPITTTTITTTNDNTRIPAIESAENKIETQEISSSNPLWKKLTVMMDEKELWREPDITLADLAKRLFTNRTTLSTLIQQQGYSGYTEYINRYRIEAFVEKAKANKTINIQELFYDVGFRSKSTAIRNFRLYMGCTPSEYIHQIEQQKNSL